MSNPNYTVTKTLDGNAAIIVAPNGDTHRLFWPGTGGDAPTLAECLTLATDEASRLNGVGVTYRLEKWVPECDGITKIKAHWQSNFIYDSEARAKQQRDEFTAQGSQWRVVRQTREVLP